MTISLSLLTTFFFLFACLISSAADTNNKDNRGLLPELTQGKDNLDNDENKSLKSEVLISQTEEKAIKALQNILQKRKGTSAEPDLLNRLAELYMRKSKSGRFFDLQRATGKTMSSFPVTQQSGLQWIKKAVDTYEDILKRFPNFSETDSILFNSAFAYQQLNQKKQSETNYKKLIERYSKSSLYPDSLLALGELIYEQGRFSEAKNYLQKIEDFPESKVYVYGLYKLGWTLYNLKDTDKAVEKLKLVILKNPPDSETTNKKGYYLRKEAIRDLVLFIGEVYPSNTLYAFFKNIITPEELGPTFFDMAKLYDSYSRLKDVHIFLNEFIEKEPKNSFVVKSHVLLADTYETLKKRELVITELSNASEKCSNTSIWRAVQSADVLDESCNKEFRRLSLELTKKWWEIWQKNKQHQEFSKLTESLLKLIIKAEDPNNPEIKTRVILAELLFQLEKYDEASQYYYFAAKNSKDKKESHDSLYASLIAREKNLKPGKEFDEDPDRRAKTLEYVTRFPEGEHIHEISLSAAVIFYNEKNYPESLKFLYFVESKSHNQVLIQKSQDLILDIFNLQKKFKELKDLARTYKSKTAQNERKTSLDKIEQEAHFSEIQQLNQNLSYRDQVQNLFSFYNAHKKSELGKQSLLDILRVQQKESDFSLFVQTAETFIADYPNYDNKPQLIKDLIVTYSDLIKPEKAAEWSLKLSELEPKSGSQHKEAAADFFLLDNKKQHARQIYETIIKGQSKEKQIEILAKIKTTLDFQNDSKDIEKINQTILDLNIEPQSTNILIEKAKKLFIAKNYKDAFDLSLKVLKRDSPSESRAPARLMQAQIFESELFTQSLKTSKEDKIGLLIQMKTEKLDKAITAYLSTTKMSNKNEIIQNSFQGIDRCYSHYIDSIKTIIFPATLSDADQTSLRKELNKIIEPIEAKQKENKELITSSLKSQNQDSWDILGGEQTPLPKITLDFNAYFILAFPINFEASKILFSESKKIKCNPDKPSLDLLTAYSCLLEKKLHVYEDWKKQIMLDKKWQIFYWAELFNSQLQGNTIKSQWIISKIKTDSSKELSEYNNKVLSDKNDVSSMDEKIKLLRNFDSSSFLPLLSKTVSLYSSQKYDQVSDLEYDWRKTPEFVKSANLKELVLPLIAESLSQTSKWASAIKLLDDFPAKSWSRPGLYYLSKARILEVYKKSPKEAYYFYDLANKDTGLSDRKSWLSKKLEFLQSQK